MRILEHRAERRGADRERLGIAYSSVILERFRVGALRVGTGRS